MKSSMILLNITQRVSLLLDTCYSGAGRADGEMLLAMAKGLVVVDEQQQKLPDNFTPLLQQRSRKA